MRLALAVLALALAAGAVAAGARLLPPPNAPPQWLLVQNGQGFSVPFGGGDRQPLASFAGLDINDISTSWDGSRLATVRGKRNEIFQVWDAAAVFAERPTTPVAFDMPRDVRIYDAGVWRRDGSGILLGGNDHGVARIYLLDLLTGGVSQLSPDGVNVDDWQPSPNGRWIEFVGQDKGSFALYLLDIQSRDIRIVAESDGETIPVGGALGWSPDSAEMTVLLEKRISDKAIWAIRPDEVELRRLTPRGQDAVSMLWSPDGAWIMYQILSPDQSCANTSAFSNRRYDTWLVRSDGSDAREIAPFSWSMAWADDSRSVLAESQITRPDAPLGGVIRVFVDGGPPELVYPYTAADRIAEYCHRYGVTTRSYRGVSRK
jgi:dipeptidyl aminopeptidase/acylaminoacyl peptidase